LPKEKVNKFVRKKICDVAQTLYEKLIDHNQVAKKIIVVYQPNIIKEDR
jgi:hypothetical protein